MVHQVLKYHIQEDTVTRGKNINTLMKYIQMVLADMKGKVIQKSLSTVNILTHTLIVLQIEILFLVVVEVLYRYQ